MSLHFEASGCCSSAHKAHTNGFSASELSVRPTGGGSGTRLVEPTYVLCDNVTDWSMVSIPAVQLHIWTVSGCFEIEKML